VWKFVCKLENLTGCSVSKQKSVLSKDTVEASIAQNSCSADVCLIPVSYWCRQMFSSITQKVFLTDGRVRP